MKTRAPGKLPSYLAYGHCGEESREPEFLGHLTRTYYEMVGGRIWIASFSWKWRTSAGRSGVMGITSQAKRHQTSAPLPLPSMQTWVDSFNLATIREGKGRTNWHAFVPLLCIYFLGSPILSSPEWSAEG